MRRPEVGSQECVFVRYGVVCSIYPGTSRDPRHLLPDRLSHCPCIGTGSATGRRYRSPRPEPAQDSLEFGLAFEAENSTIRYTSPL